MGFGSGFYTPSTGGGGTATSIAATALQMGYINTICVTKLGNDSDANGTVNKPFLTIQAALNYANTQYSDFSVPVVIAIGPGTYAENLTITRHNTYLTSQLTRPDQRAVSIIGTIIVNCSTANSKSNQIVGLQGLFVSNSTNSPTIKITGTAEHTTYLKDCYIAGNNVGSSANCLLLDSTLTVDKSKVTVENTTFLNQKAGPDIVKITGGDFNADSIRVLTSTITGAGSGIVQTGDSVVLIDRLQVDITTNGKCIDAQSTHVLSPDRPRFYLSNSSLTVSGASSEEVVYTTRGLLVWNVLITGTTTATIKGVATVASYVMYNNLVSGVIGVSGPVAPTLHFPSLLQKIKLSSL